MKTALFTLFTLSGLIVLAQAHGFASPNMAFKQMKAGNAILIDVREVKEAEGGMAKGAILMPHSQVNADSKTWQDFVKSLNPKKEIFVYCASGGRAQKTLFKLKKLGFNKVYNIGGFSSWKLNHLPTVKYTPSH